MSFPGLAIIGCDALAGIYGVNEGIVDAKGCGVQHLFCGGFKKDLIHSATSLIKDGDTIYYGNRRERIGQHPVHLTPTSSTAPGGYVFSDSFDCGNFEKTDRAFAWGKANIGFESIIANKTNMARHIEVYAYVILRAQRGRNIFRDGSQIIARGDDCHIGVNFFGASLHTIVEEGPTGFIYRLTGALLEAKSHCGPVAAKENMLCGIAIGKKVELPANGEAKISWLMGFDDQLDGLKESLNTEAATSYIARAKTYWDNYLGAGTKANIKGFGQLDRANQVAIKSAMINGFVPADLSGFYYANGVPCYYARDAMMVARAFMLAGRTEQARQIILYLLARERKPTGEFYQRYDGYGRPAEGANNAVFRQLDSIGYLLHMVYQFRQLTGKLLTSLSDIAELARVIIAAEKKYGLVGPEGGVNEGVFGPAFIVSSNMCIYGGLKAAARLLGDHPLVADIKATNEAILAGIESCFVPAQGYCYGYVTYHDDLVKKYDTPQYFGLLYGFKDTQNMRKTHSLLLKNASFEKDGIGYSEQEYHHGPWTFNTAACAQYAFKIGDTKTALAKLKWLEGHANCYGLMPEAFSADNPNICYINPLVWACAEVVAALHVSGGNDEQGH
ncbi:hypothetical protein MNBD_ALPHA12-1307 [hydrothermal vent metagenome]|uniref:Uncharacterized protein n=1 Tax=hydrothermal vent metagenome TaxID=652676 RepID=A0A3B0U9N1_9ZZZZ